MAAGGAVSSCSRHQRARRSAGRWPEYAAGGLRWQTGGGTACDDDHGDEERARLQVLKDDWVATAPGVQRARAGLDEGEGVGGAGGVDDAELEFARGLVL